MNFKIDHVTSRLSLITLIPPIEGFDEFIGAWLFRGDVSFLVDVGPASTSEALCDALDENFVGRLDFILLTHIHLDHAGGIGQVSNRFPESRIVCHPAAIPHLIDPKHLWEGTVNTLGKMGEAYGPVQPVPAHRMVSIEELRSETIIPIPTPGHAGHHVGYLFGDILFSGEAGGVVLPIETDHPYIRPATPPRLFFQTFLRSLDCLIKKNPFRICCGHYGMHQNGADLLRIHRRQLLLWEDIIEKVINSRTKTDPVDASFDKLIGADELLQGLYQMDDRVQKREIFFLKNSIRGFVEYIKEKPSTNAPLRDRRRSRET
ncbi:MAG: MBL fold metallo-hydrolase [Pseudomonadota bacterium]